MSTPAGWYPDPTPAQPGVASLRYWDGLAWTAQTGPAVAAAAPAVAVREEQKIEPLALVIAVIPLVGIIGGAIAMVKGKTLTGGLMILIGGVSWVFLQYVLPAIL